MGLREHKVLLNDWCREKERDKKLLLKILKNNPSSVEVLLSLSSAYMALNKNKSALLYARRAAALNPHSPFVVMTLAKGHVALGSVKNGIHLAKKAIRMNPKDYRSYLECAEIYSKLGREEDELKALEEAARLAPREFEVLCELSYYHWLRSLQGEYKVSKKKHHISACLEWTKKALAFDPDNTDLLMVLRYCYEGLNRGNQAAEA